MSNEGMYLSIWPKTKLFQHDCHPDNPLISLFEKVRFGLDHNCGHHVTESVPSIAGFSSTIRGMPYAGNGRDAEAAHSKIWPQV